jgi:hypothetical protein
VARALDSFVADGFLHAGAGLQIVPAVERHTLF